MPTTYVEISREEFEQWLASLSSHGSKGWSRVPAKAGLYLVHLSDLVSILVSSSIGGSDAVVAKDKGAMSMRLVARDNYARVLNRAAVDQRFYRTTNWRTTLLKKGITQFRDTYLSGKEFYDHIAEVRDLVAYQKDWLATLDQIPGADHDTLLTSLRGQLEQGKILSLKQEAIITKNLAERAAQPADVRPKLPTSPSPDLVKKVESLYQLLGWNILKSFLDQLRGGRFLSTKQEEVLAKAEAEVAQKSRAVPAAPERVHPSVSPQLIQRLEALDKALDNSFTRSLLDQARRRPLSPAQMDAVVKMEKQVSQARPAQLSTQRKVESILDELGRSDWSLLNQEEQLSPDEYGEIAQEADQQRDQLKPYIAEMGRSAVEPDRTFLRSIWSKLSRGESMGDSEYGRLRRLVREFYERSRTARQDTHIQLMAIPVSA